MCVAPWVVEKEKKSLYCSLVGFLKDSSVGVREAELWLMEVWGNKPVRCSKMKDFAVLIQFSSESEALRALQAINMHF